MKICTICKTNKSITEFNKNKVRKDGLNNICKECSRAKSRRYYSENSEYHKKQVHKRSKQVRVLMNAFLDKIRCQGCSLCPENDPCCIDFHHLSGKDENVSSIAHQDLGWNKLIKEVNKCVLLCSNCHRKVHRGHKTASGLTPLKVSKAGLEPARLTAPAS